MICTLCLSEDHRASSCPKRPRWFDRVLAIVAAHQMLTPKQEAFVLAYIETGNASEAAEDARSFQTQVCNFLTLR